MALGRETVGTAYIRILADGSGLDRSIKEEIRKADDGVRAEGGRQGDAYADEFAKRLSQKDIGKGLRDNLERSQAKTDIAHSYFDSANWKKFVGRLKQEYGDAGIIAARELQTEFRHETDEGFVQATKDIGTRIDRIREDMKKPAEEFERSWRASFEKINQDIDRFARHAGDGVDDARTHIRNAGRDIERFDLHMADAVKTMERWGREVTGREPIFARFEDRLGGISDKVGRAFGKGSRNNFVNFVGTVVGGIARIFTTVIPRALDALISPFQAAIDGFQDAQKAGQSFSSSIVSAIGAAGLALVDFIPTIGALVGALVAASLFIGPVVSAMSLLLGTVIALASSISFGLMGALAPLVGLLGPLALSIGAVAAALIGMDNKTKKLMKESIEPLKEDLKDLGDAARPGILRGLQTSVENLRQPMKQLEPLFTAAGDGIATFAGAFTDTVTGPGFNMFVDIMTRRLPGEMESLGEAMGNVFDGFLGALGSLNRKGGPVEQFLGWLAGITETFDDWATKKAVAPSIDLAGGIKRPTEGPQSGFEQFLSGIEDSANALKGVLNPLWDIIKNLMTAGKPAGDSLMTSLGDTLQDLSDWIEAHPDDVHQWFLDAADFARALGDLAVSFTKLVASFDTPGGRKTAKFLVEIANVSLGPAAGMIERLANSLNPFAAVMSALGLVPWDKINGGLSFLSRINFSKIGQGVNLKGFKINWQDVVGTPGALRNLVQSVIVRGFSGLARKALDSMGKVDLSDIVAGANRVFGVVVGPFRGLARDALLRIGTFNIADIITNLGGVAREIFNAFPSASEILHSIGTFNIMDVVDGLASVASNIISAFPTASEILNAIGHIDLSSLMHGSLDPPGPLGPWRWAEGGVVLGPRFGLMGEAGPEAIVPLNRPLHMVDPAVRELSAIAQGLHTPHMASGGVVGPAQKVVDVGGITIITPTTDPAAVAQEAINRLVAVGY